MKRRRAACFLCAGAAALGLSAAAVTSSYKPNFVDIAASAGLTAVSRNGGDVTKRFIVETTGSGVAMIDYDNDGLPDIFVLSGEGGTNRMYHNLGHDRFEDVTKALGLERTGWAQGVCAGDYDNDGFTDLFVTYYGENALYRNQGGKHFEDVSGAAGIAREANRYGTGCAFADFDRDGKLDLFVANYLRFDERTTPRPGDNPYCFYRGLAVACGPRGLPFDRNILYHNRGGGRFEDVTKASGISAGAESYALGVLVGDFDGDGWPDIYVASDQTPSLLYMNQRDGHFKEDGLSRGVALDENGRALSGMGVTEADTTGSGLLDLFRTNFSDERETLYRDRGQGEFEDATRGAGMGINTRYVGWGCGFFDYDNDGWKDLLLVNGHVFPEVERLKNGPRFRERSILYHNEGNGRFQDVSEAAGPGVTAVHAARGAAFGDIDNDGAVEVAIDSQNEPPSLLKQTEKPPGNWILLQLKGVRSNRSAIGARVKLTAAGRSQIDEVRSGGSYLSQSDLRLHFGLGAAAVVDRVDIAWPSGVKQTLNSLKANRIVSVDEQADAPAQRP